MDRTKALHFRLELLRIVTVACCDHPTAANLPRFLIYKIGDCRADFPEALLLISGVHRSGAWLRFQDFKEGPQLSCRLVLRQHFFPLWHFAPSCGCFVLPAQPGEESDLKNEIPAHRTRR